MQQMPGACEIKEHQV